MDDRFIQSVVKRASQANVLQKAGLELFETVDDVQKWVDEHGGGEIGEEALRKAAAQAATGTPLVLAMIAEWLDGRDRARADVYAAAALDVDRQAVRAAERSARASERAARYAMWSALLSAATAGAAALAFVISRVMP